MAGVQAMEIAISKARNVGVGVVTMFNSGHMGAVGHFAMMAAQKDMVGMCSVAAGTGILPTFGAEPRLGTNPISIASPSNLEAPILFDAATSAVAGNKLRLAARVDATLLPGWVASSDGSPIMEEIKIVDRDDYYQLPLGGSREQGSHKGYGFGLMVEILGSLLSGDDPGMLRDTPSWTPSRSYFAAYNVDAFTDIDDYKKNMDDMLATLKSTPPAPGHDRVLYPGLSESEEMAKRRVSGIPLHKEVIEWFSETTRRLELQELELI
jgi:LDH2 family malate/lactate/ureidoglycolate dehydrogenase